MDSSRRDLLLAGAAVLGLSACGISSVPSGTIASDINLIASGVGSIIAALTAAGVSLPQPTLARVQSAVADIQANARAISGAVAGTSGSLVGNVMNDLGALTGLLTPFFPAASLAYTILSAAVSLGEFVYTAITGRPVAQPQSLMALAPGVRPLMHMTPEEARKALGGM